MNIYLIKQATVRPGKWCPSTESFTAHEIRKITVLDRNGLPLKTAVVQQTTTEQSGHPRPSVAARVLGLVAVAPAAYYGRRFVRRGTEKSAGPLIRISLEQWKKRKERRKMLKSMAGPKTADILAKLSVTKKQPNF